MIGCVLLAGSHTDSYSPIIVLEHVLLGLMITSVGELKFELLLA